MRTDFTTAFDTEKDKKAHAPVTLMKIDWPAIGALPALTLRLADRGADADNAKLTINGTDWHAVIEDAGELDRLVDAGNFSANSVADLKVTLTNLPTALFSPAKPFSYVFDERPPESATVTVYQWFEGLLEADISEIFVGRIADPIGFDESTCSFDLVDIAGTHGSAVVGNLINLTDYPNAPQSSIGKMKPIVIGEVNNAPSILVRQAQETKVASVAAPGDSTLTVADTSDFNVSGTLKLNDDEVAYTGKTATTFTGCTGINEFHFAGDVVLEKISDHRYLFSDPDYPIKQISGVSVDGHLADAGDYTLDLPNGEVVFNKKPEKSDSVDTKFLQAQFDAIGTGNNAVDPLNAANPNTRTSYAKISQATPTLSLKQTDVMPVIGMIGKVKLRVEHFVEEKLPNDNLSVDIVGIGQVGTLSPPAMDDGIGSQGNVDITHTHLDSLGFPITDPTHEHVLPRKTEVTQTATAGLDADGFAIDSLNPTHNITFPAAPSGTIDSVEYNVNFEAHTVSGSVGQTLTLKASGGQFDIFKIGASGVNTYTPNGTLTQAPTTVTISKSLASAIVKLFNLTRTITLTPEEDTDVQSTGVSTSKTGAVTQHSSTPGVGGTVEKNTSTIVDFIDITSQVAGDWSWFTNKEVEVKYNGTSDGRTVFIIHVAFEIEYARRRLSFTDNVTALVEGVKDDGSGSVTGTADALIERPDHVFKWSLFNLLGLTASEVNATSFAQAGIDFSGAFTGGYRLAGIIQKKIEIKKLWRNWEVNCRAYFFWDLGKAGIQFRPINQISLPFTADKTILENMIRLDENGRASLRCERTPNRHIVNTIDLRYDRDWSSGEYSSMAHGSDADSITRYGRREKPDDFEFDWTRVQAQAEDLVVFFLAQYKEPSDVLELELFLDNIELERGDLLKISPSTHEGVDLPGLVLGVGRKIGSGKRRRMDSVPVSVQLMRVV
ncbi:MAG: hypothetical protein NPINA01_18030 [Nitrospinaceae bacterium]|nr:MAG: hypothetical protein NPINA01_18030 [Nitrospinaceae bacterium]